MASDHRDDPAAGAPGGPAFGPRGYLPPRAAQRARKIVLREQLGLGWVVASVLAGVLVLATGAWFVLARLGPPGPPFAAAAAAAELEAGSATRVDVAGEPVLLVRAGGRLRAFAAPPTTVLLCADRGQLEGADGTVWDLEGRRRSAAGASLAELAVEVHETTVYVDPTSVVRTAAPRDDGRTPACAPP